MFHHKLRPGSNIVVLQPKLPNYRWPVYLLYAWARWIRGISVICMGQFRRAGARPIITALKPRWHRLFLGLILYNEREFSQYMDQFYFTSSTTTYLNNGLGQYPTLPPFSQIASRRAVGPSVCLGRLEPKNRFAAAVKGSAQYRQQGGRRELIVIGDGSLRSHLQSIGDQDGLSFAGALYGSALDAYLNRAFALIHPYGLGLTINSAFGHGCPVICCRDPDVHMPEFWVWREHHNGIGFDPGSDDQQLGEALAESLLVADGLDQQTYERMSRAATQAIRGMATSGMAQRVLHLMRRVIRHHVHGQKPRKRLVKSDRIIMTQ
jgi:glycosyltransferase involved in cell wall biosynthesis